MVARHQRGWNSVLLSPLKMAGLFVTLSLSCRGLPGLHDQVFSGPISTRHPALSLRADTGLGVERQLHWVRSELVELCSA